MELETVRLRLEPYQHAHYDGLREMEKDPEMMRYISPGEVRTAEETRESIERVMLRWQQRASRGGHLWRSSQVRWSVPPVCSI